MSNRIKCVVSYDGTHFKGFQKQLKGRTIQGEIEKALSKMHKIPIEIQASGRTDRGVHAIYQVFHFDSSLEMESINWKRAINSILPKDVYIKSVEIVNNQFHARYHVSVKEYRYYLTLEEYDPLQANHVCFLRKTKSLNFNIMQEAIKMLEGTHDFKLFSSGNEREYTVRTIYEALITQTGDRIEFIFRGSGFLRYQVRVMVGTLIEIGEGRRSINSLIELLNLNEGSRAGKTAEPQGLYLYHVLYKNVDN